MNLNRSRGGKKRQMAEINVVPYIDVMLVLLVIFMITTPLLSQGVKVDLPKAKADALAAKDREPIVVTVNAEDQYFLNIAPKANEPVSPKTIQALVAQALNGDQQSGNKRSVLVKADQSVNYGMVVKVMAILQEAGAQSVGLVTDEPAIVQNTTVKSQQYTGNAWRAG